MLFAKVTATAALVLLAVGASSALPASFFAAGCILFLVAAVSAAVAMEERDATAIQGLAPSVAIGFEREAEATMEAAPAGDPVAA